MRTLHKSCCCYCTLFPLGLFGPRGLLQHLQGAGGGTQIWGTLSGAFRLLFTIEPTFEMLPFIQVSILYNMLFPWNRFPLFILLLLSYESDSRSKDNDSSTRSRSRPVIYYRFIQTLLYYAWEIKFLQITSFCAARNV